MAGNTIKGLTVEIGGDTTKLGKALQDVEKKSRSLSGELGQINRLLKMDPGNTELLAQKQKVLADAVEQTRKKLETLKEAEKQVQKQFERGEVSEEQVRALQREIIATTKKMDGYEKAVRETAEEIERLGDDSNKAGKHLDDAGKEAKKSGGELDKFAGSAKDAGDAGDTMGKKLAGAAKTGLVAIGTAAVGLVTGLVASAEATREYRGEMGKLESAYTTAGHKAETATKAYQTLQGVIGETDQSVEAAQQIALLANSEQDAAKWAGLAAGVVGRFGDALQPETFFESANETIKLGEAMGTYVQLLEGTGYSVDKFNAGLEACTTAQEKQAYMLKITDQLLGGAADKYRETNAEVIRANEANEAWMASMADVGGALEPILSDVKLLGASLLSEAVPGVQGLAEAFRGILNGDAGASADFGAQLSGLVTSLLDKLTGMLPTVADVGVSLIATLATSMVQQIPTLLSTGGQIASQLLGGIAANAPSMAQGALDLIGGLLSGFQTNLPLVLAQGREILLNLSQGIADNLPNLLSQALDMLMSLATTLYDNAPMLIQTGFDVLSNLVTGIVNSIPVLLSKGPEIISKFANIINDNFPTILAKGVQLIGQLVIGILQAIPTLIANAPKIITAIVDVWEAFNWLSLGKKAITLLKDGVLGMLNAVKSAGKSIMEGITTALKNLPSNLLNLGKTAVSGLGNAIKSGLSTVKSSATAVVNGVVNTVKSLPTKMLSVGKDLVRGLWNGISDMTGWVIGKIQGFGESVLGGIKSFFGIHSPSTVMEHEVGEMLPAGVARGIEGNEDEPIKAMNKLSRSLLDEAEAPDGLTLERKLKTTFSAPAAPAPIEAWLLEKLDKILEAIERGQILAIDGDRLIGETAAGYDAKLGQRAALAARGAL